MKLFFFSHLFFRHMHWLCHRIFGHIFDLFRSCLQQIIFTMKKGDEI